MPHPITPSKSSPVAPGLLARALGRAPQANESIEVPLDLVVLGGVAGPEVVQLMNSQGARPWEASCVAMTFDFPAPEVEARIPRSRGLCREFAARHDIRQVYDLNLGIGAHVMLELGLLQPGQIVAGCGRCMHLGGAVGALVLGAEPGLLARAVTSGRLALRTPPVVQIRFEGNRRASISAYDMGLAACQATAALSVETVLEFVGKAVELLSMDGRITLVDVAAAGFRAGLVPADAVTATFLGPRLAPRTGDSPPRGGGMAAAAELCVGLDGLEPLVQGPGPGGPIRPLSHLSGKKIHSAFIGSCAAGRTADLMAAAAYLKRAGRIHPDVQLTVAPATLDVARECLHNGVYETLLTVGAMIGLPGSSPGVAGGGAQFGEGEVIVSTAWYNHPMADAGRGPEIYRASPAVVAAAAVAGEIRTPD